jgi:hypothetical protein
MIVVMDLEHPIKVREHQHQWEIQIGLISCSWSTRYSYWFPGLTWCLQFKPFIPNCNEELKPTVGMSSFASLEEIEESFDATYSTNQYDMKFASFFWRQPSFAQCIFWSYFHSKWEDLQREEIPRGLSIQMKMLALNPHAISRVGLSNLNKKDCNPNNSLQFYGSQTNPRIIDDWVLIAITVRAGLSSQPSAVCDWLTMLVELGALETRDWTTCSCACWALSLGLDHLHSASRNDNYGLTTCRSTEPEYRSSTLSAYPTRGFRVFIIGYMWFCIGFVFKNIFRTRSFLLEPATGIILCGMIH